MIRDFDTPIQRPERTWPTLAHYYGDLVRVLFLITAVFIGLALPLSGNIQLGVLFGGPAVILLAILAGYTNPHSSTILLLDAITAAVGVLAAETFAVVAYSVGNFFVFALLEVAFALFLVALYFSVKSLRSAWMHKIGRIDGVGEFDDPSFLDVKDDPISDKTSA
jgi:hypothetical protein